MFNRKIQNCLNFLRYSAADKAREYQLKYHADGMTTFEEVEKVYIKDFRNPHKPSWTISIIVSRLGKGNYLCTSLVGERLKWCRHLNHIVNVDGFYHRSLDVVDKNVLCDSNFSDIMDRPS